MLATINDKKLATDDGNGEVAYYEADVVTANDYYPFGMIMPGRKYAASELYRYGFNGKENDNEVKGEGGQQDYGMRIYDPRLGRFLSVDPLTADYPWYTPYQFAGNDVIRNIDLDGGEPKPVVSGNEKEMATVTTSEERIQGVQSRVVTAYQRWVYHEGGVNGSSAGWMKEEDYFEDVLKPLGKQYNEGQVMASWSFAVSRKLYGETSEKGGSTYEVASMYDDLVVSAAKYIKENPTVDNWEKWLPIWGSWKQAYLDYSVGKWGWGTFNTLMGVSDVFLAKSLLSTPLKGGFSALTKSYKHWSSWRRFYGQAGGAEAGEQMHHWLLMRNGAKSGDGFMWWLKNQRWNLVTMTDSRLLGLKGSQIHTLVHGGTLMKTGLSWKGPLGTVFRYTYGTPTWFKTSINYGLNKTLNFSRQ